jgi:hypothetical protein
MSDRSYSKKDEDVNFSNYKTFAWLPKDSASIQNVLFDNQIIEKSIQNLTNNELIKKGYSIETDTPDVLVRYTLMVEQKHEKIINTQVVTNPVMGPIQPYNANAYDNPSNLYYYSNPGNIYNSGYHVNNYPYYSDYGFPTSGVPYQLNNNVYETEFKEGTLIIDFIDRESGNLIWRGWSTNTLNDPNSFEKNLPNEISQIFAKYPEVSLGK